MSLHLQGWTDEGEIPRWLCTSSWTSKPRTRRYPPRTASPLTLIQLKAPGHCGWEVWLSEMGQGVPWQCDLKWGPSKPGSQDSLLHLHPIHFLITKLLMGALWPNYLLSEGHIISQDTLPKGLNGGDLPLLNSQAGWCGIYVLYY